MKNEEIIEENQTQYDDDAYLFKLENFEGPLDLLLEIIKKNKMDIEDVKLADITGQYLKYMEGLERLDMEKASEFIVVASTLIEIKSKSLMPRLEEETKDELEDSEALLMQRLKEYQLFKEVGETLKGHENINHFYREPDANVGAPKFVLKDMAIDNLLDAFANLLTRSDKKIISDEPKTIKKDRFTVAEKMESTKELLLEKKSIKFTELFDEDQTRSELINCFLAVLELLKRSFAKIRQNDLFAEIEIILNEDN